jgi:hypothetical protein
VVYSVSDPIEESDGREKVVLLPQLIQLRVPIEHSRRYKLVEHSDNQRRENGEDYIEKGHRPTFECNLSREVVEPGILLLSKAKTS